ncbi:MAG: tetratricopeptide repeat protein [Chloroflexi bacterium]|nr:tetratricopeptide repeat protein [Chloroflexota bacterium]
MNDPIDSLEEALRLSPANVPLRLYVAGMLAEKGYWLRALDHYREAAAAEPGNVDASLGLGKALLQQGDPTAAVRVLNRALGMDPESRQAAMLHVELARALLTLGQDSDAREHYRNGVRCDASAADRDLAARLYEGSVPAAARPISLGPPRAR